MLLLNVVDGLPTSPYHIVWQLNRRWHNAALREQLRATIAEGEDDYCDGEELGLEESSRVLSATAKAQVRAHLAQLSWGQDVRNFARQLWELKRAHRRERPASGFGKARSTRTIPDMRILELLGPGVLNGLGGTGYSLQNCLLALQDSSRCLKQARSCCQYPTALIMS